jgi:hypothetical protein
MAEREAESVRPAELQARFAGPDNIVATTFLDIGSGTDPASMLENSSLVIVGSVIATEAVDLPVEIDLSDASWPTPGPGIDRKSFPQGSIQLGEYSTRYMLSIEEVVKSDGATAGEVVDVLEMGAVLDGKEYAYDNIPIYRTGERYLLFLRPNPTRRAVGDYGALGAYGSFLLLKGKPYRALGEFGNWIPYEQHTEAELLSLLHAESAGAPP